jgi:hypothetical protein
MPCRGPRGVLGGWLGRRPCGGTARQGNMVWKGMSALPLGRVAVFSSPTHSRICPRPCTHRSQSGATALGQCQTGSAGWHGSGGGDQGCGGGGGHGNHCRLRIMTLLQLGVPLPQRHSSTWKAVAMPATNIDKPPPHIVARCGRISSCRGVHLG